MPPSPLPSQGPHMIVRALAHARSALLSRVRTTAQAPDRLFPSAFAQLVAVIEAAFAKEETLMETIGFSGVRAQRRDNALLLRALHHAAPRVEEGELALGREVVAALPALLSLHRFCGLRVLAERRGASSARGRGLLHGAAARAPRRAGRQHPA